MELHDHLHLGDTHRDDDLFVILSWSPRGASLEPSSQAHIFRYLGIIMLLLLGETYLIYRSDSVVDLDEWDHTFDVDDLMLFNFLTYHIFDGILGNISSLVEICRSPLICMIIPSCEIHTELMIYFHFVLILQWSLSWVVQSGSYFFILLWFLVGVISDA